MVVKRSELNPIIDTEDITPTSADMEVVGAFNPGVAVLDDQIVLMVRVAEKPKEQDDSVQQTIRYDPQSNTVVLDQFLKSDSGVDLSDLRIVRTASETRLTSMSHFRIATSHDGLNFRVADEPDMFPANEYETFGIEDPRITQIGREYFITYSAISPRGIVTSLARTEDFKSFERLGNIFHPDNKDVTLFPAAINGTFFALHRPSSSEYAKPNIWIAESDDLVKWGNHRYLLGVRPNHWDEARVGASAVPILTSHGWIEIYHGADRHNRYCLGAVLLDANEPWKVIARSQEPLMEPEEVYEQNGFFGGVIFSCGAVLAGDKVRIYYGASDSSIGHAEVTLNDLLDHLNVVHAQVP